MIRFDCPGCGKRLKVDPESIGRPVHCPRCNAAITTPTVRGHEQPPVEPPSNVLVILDATLAERFANRPLNTQPETVQ